MFYIRKFLQEIRKMDSKLNEKQKIAIAILSLFVVGISIVIDTFVPFNFWTNTIRAFISLYLGVILFSYSYVYSLNRADKKKSEDKTYTPLREKYSYNERRNLSIFAIGIWLIFALIVSKPGPLFTSSSSLLIFFIFVIFSFLRSTREENIKASYAQKDIRDVKFEQKRLEELEKRKEKRLEKEKAKE